VFNALRHSGDEVMIRAASDLWAEHRVDFCIVAVADVVGPYTRTLEDAGYRIHRLLPSAPRMPAIADTRNRLPIFGPLAYFSSNVGFMECPHA
jgi:hypothetical protein